MKRGSKKRRKQPSLLLAKAKNGDIEAQNDVGLEFFKGGKYKKALIWFQKAAKAGYPDAQFNLASLYERGLGVEKNYRRSFKLYLALAKSGDAGGQYDVGRLYERGWGVKRDYSQAAKWYRKAALQDFAWAQIGLASLFAHGQGVKRSESEALFWYSVAAVGRPVYGPLKASAEKTVTRAQKASVKRRVIKWRTKMAKQRN